MQRLMLCALLYAIAGCTSIQGTTATREPQRSDRLVIGQGREFNSLLPFVNNGFTTSELIGLAFSLLVTLGPRGYVPDAVTRVPTLANGDISRDGLTYTYHLRRDIRWQDGRSLTARDVIFTQSTVMNPHALMPYRDGFDRVSSIVATDPYTIVVHLKHPYRLFVTNFLGPESATGILPEHLLSGVSDIEHSAYAAAPIGSGPYRIGNWHRGESVEFTANPDWYGGRPTIKTIDVRFIPNPSTRLTQLRTHEIDAEMNVSADTAAQIRGAPGIRVDVEGAPVIMQLSFNLHEAIVNELPVRLAIAQAIDAQTIARKVSHGLIDGRDAGRGLYLWAYDARANYPVYDPRAAARRLDAAHWRPGADGIRRDASGRRLAFTIALRADRADDNAAAVQVQQQLRLLGIDVALKTYSAPQFTGNDGTIRSGTFTAELSQYFPNIEPDPTIFFACADRGLDGFNESGYCDATADAAMDASLQTSDRRLVRQLLSRAQRTINTSLPMILLWQGVDINVVPAQLTDFSDLLGEPFSNVGTWKLSS